MADGAAEQWRDLLRPLELHELEPLDSSAALQAWAAGAGGEQSGGASIVSDGGGPLSPDDIFAALCRSGVADAIDEALDCDEPITVVVNDTHRQTDTRLCLDALAILVGEHGRVVAGDGFGLDGEPAWTDGLAAVSSGREAMRNSKLRLLVAAGSHHASAEERREHESRILGPHGPMFTEIAWHDASDGAGLRRVGDYGVHHWLAEGGVCLGIGSMEPHYFAGITGAHKTLTVGVMARESIEANHAGAMRAEAAPLRLSGNPVHEDVCAALEALENTDAFLLALNQIIVGGAVVAASAGTPLGALEAGASLVRTLHGRTIAEPVDLLVARVAPPLDRDLYQADKGIKNTEAAVADGGVLLVEAACPGGVGIDHFVELLAAASSHDAAVHIVGERGYRLGDHKAVRLRRLTDLRGVRLGIVSDGLDPALGAVLGASVFSSRAEAAAWAQSLLPPTARALLVEDAGNTVVELEDS